jgi:hypothetical protein
MTTINVGPNTIKRTILTGAGFTKNYGGYLAREINNKVLSDPKIVSNKKLHDLILNEFNYEDALGIVQPPDYTQEESAILQQAIRHVYDYQDKIITDWTASSKNVSRYKSPNPLTNFIKRTFSFSGNCDEAYLFTTNQDLFIEACVRIDHMHLHRPIYIPGLSNADWGIPIDYFPHAGFKRVSVVDSESALKYTTLKHQINYIKLHGSANWDKEDGELLVIGKSKEAIIDKSPILRTYHRLFSQVCNVPDMRMLIIGYGFSDNHINRHIVEGIKSGLKLWVWDKLERQHWMQRVREPHIEGGEAILGAIEGYLDDDSTNIFYGNTLNQNSFDLTLDRFLNPNHY